MKKLSVLLILSLLLSLLGGCAALPVLPGQPASTAANTGKPSDTAGDSSAGTASAPGESTAAPGPEDGDGVHPMLFHVTGAEGQEGWLFGTIHVGDERVYRALDKLTPYLDGCNALAVEFDLVAYEKDLAAQMKSMTQFVLTDGTKADDHMPAETYEKAAALLEEAGLYPALMRSYNLSMWSQLVEQAALMTKTDYDMEIGMDRALIEYCYGKKIEVRDVESAEFQYELMEGFSDELNLLLIENTLDNLDEYGRSIDELYAAWLKGDPEELEAVLTEEDGEEDFTEDQLALLEDYNDRMLTQRNLGMRDKAVEWLEAGDKIFFAVGAAHLLTEDGLAALLREAGYTVEQVDLG